MAMTESEIVHNNRDKVEMTKKECTPAAETTIDINKGELGKGNTVKISGFGKWTAKSKKERKGRNPQTGKRMAITARRVVTFKSSEIMNNEVST